MPSVKLALDHVNEHSDILTNYRLHMWWNDTQVNNNPKQIFSFAKSKLVIFNAHIWHQNSFLILLRFRYFDHFVVVLLV